MTCLWDLIRNVMQTSSADRRLELASRSSLPYPIRPVM